MSLRRRAAAIGVIAAVPLLALATPAFAHAGLVSTTPAEGSVVTTSPPQVVLTFDEPVLDEGAGILVTDAAGNHYEQANTLHYGGAKISIKLDPLGDAGTYTVAWRVVADDGDPQSETYTFTYRPAGSSTDSASPTVTPTATPTATPTSASASATAAVDEVESASSSPSPWVWALLIVVAVVVIMVVIVVMRRGRGGSDSST